MAKVASKKKMMKMMDHTKSGGSPRLTVSKKYRKITPQAKKCGMNPIQKEYHLTSDNSLPDPLFSNSKTKPKSIVQDVSPKIRNSIVMSPIPDKRAIMILISDALIEYSAQRKTL